MSIKNVNLELERSGVGMGIRKVAQWCLYSDFTDGTAAAGTLALTEKIPAGSFVLGSKVRVTTGFTGDTSCTLDVGDGSDPDLFSYTTHNIYTAANNLMEGCDSAAAGNTGTGIVPILTETTITLTATGGSDWGDVTAGRLLVEVFYFSTHPEFEVDYPDSIKFGT